MWMGCSGCCSTAGMSEEIRRPEISLAASSVSAMDTVRAFLFDLQRNMALEHNVVMDGRDIGTVVLPDAQVKIYLTASAEERTRRRIANMRPRACMRTLKSCSGR